MNTTLPRLYAHPFSSYCQKALVALYENDTPFEYRHLEDPQANAELIALWPMRRFPVLLDAGRTMARPSFRRAVEEARPYRHYFPLGAPERD